MEAIENASEWVRFSWLDMNQGVQKWLEERPFWDRAMILCGRER